MTRVPYEGSPRTVPRALLDEGAVQVTHRLLSSSFLGLPYRILNEP